MPKDTFLTDMQVKILELRARGLTQSQIADQLKTSRANICIIERRARENLAKAERTVKFAAKLRAPAIIELKPGDDIMDAPKMIFEAADGAKIKVNLSTPEIIAKIKESSGNRLQGRSVRERIELVLTRDGGLLIY
jgi:Tfx family DNA-binding protein